MQEAAFAVVMDTADNMYPCCGVSALCAVWKAVCVRCVMCCTHGLCVPYGLYRKRALHPIVCVHACACAYTHQAVWCVQQVVYVMPCVHQTVFIRVRAEQQVVCTLWAVVYGGGGVCSKQPGLSVCSESGAAGGPRCGTHCL